jgi:hypothetical protein
MTVMLIKTIAEVLCILASEKRKKAEKRKSIHQMHHSLLTSQQRNCEKVGRKYGY